MMIFDTDALPVAALPAAATFQMPAPDSRRHAIMAARLLLEQALEMRDDDIPDAVLMPYVAHIKQTVRRLERALQPRSSPAVARE